jgi:hypothetical protein
MGSKSMKKDEFSKLPGDQIFRELNMETVNELDKRLQKNREDDEHSISFLTMWDLNCESQHRLKRNWFNWFRIDGIYSPAPYL